MSAVATKSPCAGRLASGSQPRPSDQTEQSGHVNQSDQSEQPNQPSRTGPASTCRMRRGISLGRLRTIRRNRQKEQQTVRTALQGTRSVTAMTYRAI
ncbi:hypothetical protein HMPREF0291_10683 [Corynebacterium genitalium ATCC 33030]|uniref:Uncharacterized protein n=1 Tax=Corynebacterium genitalium ATCC 33030 TaxID=585529 RepID=D7W9E5_9CORY|nr:hypothetical protein HMPREF0291_10683 [Corynebacterium genitalium ATCC 33030]